MLSQRGRAGRDWPNNYPPLAVAGVAMLLLLALLPSALNLPQANPTESLEYAPVPPDDSAGSPPDGNFASMGLGTGRGLASGALGAASADEPGGALPGGRSVKTAGTKRCVGDPPRQTEDRLSPPCVGFFAGDNGGATAVGVTAEEVRVVLYQEGATGAPGPNDSTPCERWIDLAEPLEEGSADERWYRAVQAYQRYFNDRFQTYGRFVHFWVHQGRCATTAEARRADAIDAVATLEPFAVTFGPAISSNLDAYLDEVTRQGVLAFMNPFRQTNQPRSVYLRSPGLIWSHVTTIEHQSQLYVEFVCRQIVDRTASFSGNAADLLGPRKLGQLYAADPAVPNLTYQAGLIAEGVRRCGGEIAVTRTGSYNNTLATTSQGNPEATREAAANMAEFKRQGVTTILWTGMTDITHSHAAAAIDYRPEFVLLGSLNVDTNEVGTLQDQTVWRNAMTISQHPFASSQAAKVCVGAAQEANPELTPQDVRYHCRYTYEPLRQLFTGIQLAGPNLTARNMDRGFHAIPPVASTDPTVPSCFYGPRDYSCVKDAIAMWWDPAGPGDNYYGQPGCYRITEGGRRHLLGTWPDREASELRDMSAPCNNYA